MGKNIKSFHESYFAIFHNAWKIKEIISPANNMMFPSPLPCFPKFNIGPVQTSHAMLIPMKGYLSKLSLTEQRSVLYCHHQKQNQHHEILQNKSTQFSSKIFSISWNQFIQLTKTNIFPFKCISLTVPWFFLNFLMWQTHCLQRHNCNIV